MPLTTIAITSRGRRAGRKARIRSAQPAPPTRGPLARGTARTDSSWRFGRCPGVEAPADGVLRNCGLSAYGAGRACPPHSEGDIHARSLALRQPNETRPQLQCISCPPDQRSTAGPFGLHQAPPMEHAPTASADAGRAPARAGQCGVATAPSSRPLRTRSRTTARTTDECRIVAEQPRRPRQRCGC
jgi:hypothetical protein